MTDQSHLIPHHQIGFSYYGEHFQELPDKKKRKYRIYNEGIRPSAHPI